MEEEHSSPSMYSFNSDQLSEQKVRLVSCGMLAPISSPEVFQSSISKPKNILWFHIRRAFPPLLGHRDRLHSGSQVSHSITRAGLFFLILLNLGVPK